METIAVDALTGQHNYAVIRLPARKYPGVVVQGDSLSILVADLRRGLDLIQLGEISDGIVWVTTVLEALTAAQHGYETALAAHSIPLPYFPTP